jgi:membrane-associated protease RseP (regulator of RpoE activity)
MAASLGVVVFCILILFVIFFHEFGHFITARWAGIKVTKFFIGFGPTLWSTRRGQLETVTGPDGTPVTRPETEYGVKAFPLGGFVKIVGMSPYEEVPASDEPRSFDAAPTWKRAIVLVAGSATHFITAFVVLVLIFSVVGFPDLDRPTLTVGAVESEIAGKESPAKRAGLEAGDKIVSVDGRRLDGFEEIRDRISAAGGRSVSIDVVKPDGARKTIELKPVIDRAGGETRPVIGIYPQGEISRQNPIEAIASSGRTMGFLVTTFFQRVPEAFDPETLGLTGGKPTEDRPFSIVGAGRIAADYAARGRILDFMFLFVQINIFVAIFNMVPLPPLDGGHLLVLGIQKVRGKAISQRALVPVMAMVLSVLLILAVWLLYNDIVAPPQLPGP